FLSFRKGLINRAHHVEGLFRNVVIFAFDDFLEATHGVRNLDVFAFKAGELRGHEHGLRKEFFDFARASNRALVFVRKLLDAENGDDVLQIFVALQNGLHATGDGVMFRADDARIENARVTGQRIDGGINAALEDLAAQVCCCVQVRKRRGRGGVRIIVGGNVNGLHGSDRAGLVGGDALLQFANFCVEVWLVTDSGRHTAEERGNFRTRLDETENIVDEKKNVEMLFVAEIFGDSQTGEADPEARAGRLGHLAVDQSSSGLLRIAGDNHAGFLELQPKVVSFTGTLADACEYGHAAVRSEEPPSEL